MLESLMDFSRLKKKVELKEDEKFLNDTTGLKDYKKQAKKSLQQLIKDSNTTINTKDLVYALFQRFANHRFLINNAYIFPGWESDFITVTESMYLYEIETKISKSDYKEDFLKTEKHTILESTDIQNNKLRPNKLYYCTPAGLLATYEIPKYAGLMEVSRDKNNDFVCKTTKEAPFLHKENVFNEIKEDILEIPGLNVNGL